MKLPVRLVLATVLLVVDLVTFAVPLTALAAAYVIVVRPTGFLHWVLRLYDDGAGRGSSTPAP